MSQLSDYAENAIMNSLFGKTSDFGALASRPTLYLALCTTAIIDSDTGATITEVAYTGYARKVTAASDWDTSSGGIIDNVNELSFPQATGGSAVATHFAFVDAATAGKLIAYGTLTASLNISSGHTPRFQVGALTAQLS